MTGALKWTTLLAAVPVGLLATNILVVNNYRDMETDARANKRTLVVRFGRAAAEAQYALSFAVAFIVPVVLALLWVSWGLAAPLVLASLALRLQRRLQDGGDGPTLNKLLAATAQFLLAYGVIWAGVLAFTSRLRF